MPQTECPCSAEDCSALLAYLKSDKSADCLRCGKRHISSSTKPGPPVVKVLGLSTYHCKLISPLLTRYGIDKAGNFKTLQELKNCATFDCSLLGDRSFCIEPHLIDVPGYGRDISGSAEYLSGTLSLLKEYNDDRECLVPLHVDGDGHCLVHAVSRAIVGRELFWHTLRTGLKLHLMENLRSYQNLLGDFINSSEWGDIIAECDPEYEPLDNEMLGLRNVHIFGLANVLCRPILLVDSVAGMQSSGDYSALFLPGLVPPEKCRDKSGNLNRPICLAWSSSGRNHYIPLVGIAGQPPPVFPRSLLPKVWGVPQNLIQDYIVWDSQGCLTIGGGKSMPASYLLKLTSAMDKLFGTKYSVDPGLVADVYYTNFRRSGTDVLGVHTHQVQSETAVALQQRRLYRCLSCGGASLQPLCSDWLRPQGLLYNLAKRNFRYGLRDQHTYAFPNYGVTCIYNAKKDLLVVNNSTRPLDACSWCDESNLRLIHPDGTVLYENGDRTTTPVQSETAQCKCGFKHWWNGKEYDNSPHVVKLRIEWAGRTVVEDVQWFSGESDPSLNSNAFQVASNLMHKHFPGEFNSERLRQLIVDQILEKTHPSSLSASEQLEDVPPFNAPSLTALQTALLYNLAKFLPKYDQTKQNPVDSNEMKCDTQPSCAKTTPYIAQGDKGKPNTAIGLPAKPSKAKVNEVEIPQDPATVASSNSANLSESEGPQCTSNVAPKKRLNESSSQGAVPKTRSLPAAQAAAAALNRAKLGDASAKVDVEPEIQETAPQNTPRMIKLGPGFSVLATDDKKPSTAQYIDTLLECYRSQLGQWERHPGPSRDHVASREGSQLVSENDSSAPGTLSELVDMFRPQDNENMIWSDGEEDGT